MYISLLLVQANTISRIRGWEEKDKGQDSGPFEVHGNAAIDFSEARVLAEAFLQNQHLCRIFTMDITEKDQKEGDAVHSAVAPLKQIIVMPKHSYDRR